MTVSSLTNFHTGAQGRLRLFCFAYAGAGASIFRRWQCGLPKAICVVPIELPGRGRRLHEAPYTRMQDLIPDVANSVSSHLDLPFVLFGHSLGAFIAFELAHHLKLHYGKEPELLFVSGNRPPHLPRPGPVVHNLPHNEFCDELLRLNGTPREILFNSEAMSLISPMLRADFEVLETYCYQEKPLLSCPIRAYGGLQDSEIPMEELGQWRRHTSGTFSLNMLPGDHFFITRFESQLLSALATDLEWCLNIELKQ